MFRGMAVLAALITTGPLHAQADPDSIKHQAECLFAKQVVVTGQPAPDLRWALGYLAACGAGAQGSAVAQGVRRLRTEADTAVLRPYWRVAQYLRDRHLFEAAEEIATDRSASTQARVFAIAGLIGAVRDRSIADYDQLVGGFRPDGLVAGGCWWVVSGEFQRTETPLPDNYLERVTAVRERLRNDPSEPLDVRTAASCLRPAPR